MPFTSIEKVQETLREGRYITDRSLATVIYLAVSLGKPLLLEGEAGVGKTDVAKVMASALKTPLIRLQCYEGLDVNTALYEWNYPKQLLRIRLEEGANHTKDELGSVIFGEEYLIRRPLLQAIQNDGKVPPVLLIDEIDRSDEEFEAFLLEILSDFQITIPEIGTIKAKRRPYVVLTSNRTRELHDALKRRCLYHWIDYPTFEKEYQILLTKVPQVKEVLARQICGFMQVVRKMDLYKKPGIAETLDWASALMVLHKDELDDEVVTETLGCIFKYREDVSKMEAEIMGKKIDLQKVLDDYLSKHFG
ncbi:MAG: MoxR family ATPase [Dehalococcoidia bacterium]|nr:MoxR family ATPase [Dehalococcoidia bacterium]